MVWQPDNHIPGTPFSTHLPDAHFLILQASAGMSLCGTFLICSGSGITSPLLSSLYYGPSSVSTHAALHVYYLFLPWPPLFFCELIEDWISFFFVSLVPRSVTSTKYRDNSINILEGMTIKIDELFVMAWEMHSQVLENLFTNHLLEHNIFWSWGLLALCCMLSGLCPGWAWVNSIFSVNYSGGRVMWDMPRAGIGTKWGRSWGFRPAVDVLREYRVTK